LLFAVLFVVAVGFFYECRRKCHRGSGFVCACAREKANGTVVFKRQFLIHNGLKIDNASVSGEVATVNSHSDNATQVVFCM
jgi:hypothetical protein